MSQDPNDSAHELFSYAVLAWTKDAVICLDNRLYVLFANAAARMLFPLGDPLIARNAAELFSPGSVLKLRNVMQRIMSGDRTQPRVLTLEAMLSADEHIAVEATYGFSPDGEQCVLALRDISESRRTERVLQFLNAIATEANHAVVIDRFILFCLERICRFMHWPAAHAYLVSGEPSRERVHSSGLWFAQMHLSAAFRSATEQAVFRRGEGLPGKVLEKAEPVWLSDLNEVGRFRRLKEAHAMGLRSAMAFPAVAGRTVVGVMEFYNTTNETQNDDVMHVLMNVGAQLGRVIERINSEQAVADLNMVLQNAVEGIAHVDPFGIFTSVNRRYAEMAGYQPQDLVGKNWTITTHLEDIPLMESALEELPNEGRKELELRGLRSDQTTFYRQMVLILKSDRDQKLPPSHYQFVKDISDRKLMEEKLVYSAFHDQLTDLANRASFMESLERAIAHGQRRKEYQFGVLFVDLDDFKSINDSYGHLAGDQLLREVAKRLQTCLRLGDIAGRLGGDEFAVLLDDISSAEDAEIIAQRILDEFSKPVAIGSVDVSIQASIGIATNRDDVSQATELLKASELLKSADKAMYKAKTCGKGGFRRS